MIYMHVYWLVKTPLMMIVISTPMALVRKMPRQMLTGSGQMVLLYWVTQIILMLLPVQEQLQMGSGNGLICQSILVIHLQLLFGLNRDLFHRHFRLVPGKMVCISTNLFSDDLVFILLSTILTGGKQDLYCLREKHRQVLPLRPHNQNSWDVHGIMSRLLILRDTGISLPRK